MRRRFLRLAIFLLLTTPVFAQDVSINLGAMAGIEATTKESWGGRLYFGLPLGEFVYISPVSWSMIHTAADSTWRLSVNPLFALPWIGVAHAITTGKPGWLAVGLLALPQLIGNPTLNLPLLPEHLFLTASQRTDFYLFSNEHPIYSESSVGLRLHIYPVVAEARYVWPVTKGYLEDRGPYVGLNLYYGGKR